jgi:bacillithiol system protein YtxJ
MPGSEPFVPLTDASDLQAAVATSQACPVVLFKHSRWCGLSRRARQALAHLSTPGEPCGPVIYELVEQSPVLSREVAQAFSITHETPQAIVLHRGRPIFHAAHHRITAEAVREAAQLPNISTANL